MVEIGLVVEVYPFPSRLWGMGSVVKLPQRGLRWSPNRERCLYVLYAILCYFRRVLVHFWSRLPGIITLKIQENITGIDKVTLKKGIGRALVIAPHSRHGHLRGAQVHGAHQAASDIPALYLPSRSWYSFTDPQRMEGWVSPGPGCK